MHPNPMHMHSAVTLLDILDCMSFVRSRLRGEGARGHACDTRGGLALRGMGRGSYRARPVCSARPTAEAAAVQGEQSLPLLVDPHVCPVSKPDPCPARRP